MHPIRTRAQRVFFFSWTWRHHPAEGQPCTLPRCSWTSYGLSPRGPACPKGPGIDEPTWQCNSVSSTRRTPEGIVRRKTHRVCSKSTSVPCGCPWASKWLSPRTPAHREGQMLVNPYGLHCIPRATRSSTGRTPEGIIRREMLQKDISSIWVGQGVALGHTQRQLKTER